MARRTRHGRYQGRPPGLTPAVERDLLRVIEDGMPLTWAALYVGVSYDSFNRWMRSGEAAQTALDDGVALDSRDKMFRDFREQVLRARASAMKTHVGVIHKAATGGYVLSESPRTSTDETGNLVTEVSTTYAAPIWGAARFMLQTSFAADFAAAPTRTAVEVSGPDRGPISISETRAKALATRVGEIVARQQVEREALSLATCSTEC